MRINRKLWAVLLPFLILCVLATPCGALGVSPVAPTTSDAVTVSTDIYVPTTCFQIAGQTCEVASADTLRFTVDVVYCNNQPVNCICGLYPVHFVRSCNFGTLPAGPYTVFYTELHNSPGDPMVTVTQVFTFNVTALVPVLDHSWGQLKLLYR